MRNWFSKLGKKIETAVSNAYPVGTTYYGGMSGAGNMNLSKIEHAANQIDPEEAKEFKKEANTALGVGTAAAATLLYLPTFILTMKWLGTPLGKTLLGNMGKDMLVGTAGYLATDEASKAMTGRTVGQQVADGLGKVGLEKVPYSVREGIGNFVNPGGWLTWGGGSKFANLLYIQGKNLIGKGILYITPYTKSAIIASKLNRLINKTTLPLYSTRYYTKSVGLPGHVNYTLHNADGSVAGGLKVESPYSAGTRGTHIEMVHKTSGSKGGVSEDLYNIAVKDALRAGFPGVESGLDLMNPLLTKHVTSKFPNVEEMIGTPQMVKNPTTGKWEFKQTIPGRMLTGTTSKLLALEAPQGHFITNYSATATNTPPKTSLAFFERQPAKISEAERLGIHKDIRNNFFKNVDVTTAWRGTPKAYTPSEHSTGMYGVTFLSPSKDIASAYGIPHQYAFPDNLKLLDIDFGEKSFNNIGTHSLIKPTPELENAFNIAKQNEFSELKKYWNKRYGTTLDERDVERLSKVLHLKDWHFLYDAHDDFLKLFYRNRGGINNPLIVLLLPGEFNRSNLIPDDLYLNGQMLTKFTPFTHPELPGGEFNSIDEIGRYIESHPEFQYDGIRAKNVVDFGKDYTEPLTLLMLKKTIPIVFVKKYGGYINTKKKNKGKFAKVRDYVDYKNNK